MKKMNHYNTIAVIPARGGSKGIPRKNACLISGKPLIAYSIEASKAAACFLYIYVSTDDLELAEIARRFGAQVIDRPPKLADDTSTLDDVIVDAYRQLQAKHSSDELRFIATIQPTSPLLSPQTILRAVDLCVAGDCDTVMTVINEPHLAWTICGTKPLPLYDSRVNRQKLPPYLRETGGVVVCSVEQLGQNTRFGSRIKIVEVSKEEAIDVDDYFDWYLAEKAMRRKKILFHVLGNHDNGLGHVYRALTLAYRLMGHHVSFLVNEESLLAARILKAKYQDVTVVKTGTEIDFILERRPNLLINDVLDTSSEFMARIRLEGIASVNFEDQGRGSQHADILINSMYDEDFNGSRKNAYHGVEYCCLRDEFYTIGPKPPAEEVRNILLLFGGTDPSGLTQRCLQWVDQLSGMWSVTVLMGPGYKDVSKLTQLALACTHEVTLVRDSTIVSKYMAEADIAITSAGRTVFELAALSVPMIVIAQNEREQSHIFANTAPGVINLGAANTVSKKVFAESLEELISSRLLRTKMHQALSTFDIRGGIDRVLRLIEQAVASV